MNAAAAENSQLATNPVGFVERRRSGNGDGSYSGERRQFGNSYQELTAEGRELAVAIDDYKLKNRRRYITPDEMLQIVQSLGYQRAASIAQV